MIRILCDSLFLFTCTVCLFPGMARCSKLWANLTRRKPAEDWFYESALKRCLTAWDLTFIGVSAVVGAGLYVVTGELARDIAGPAVVLSFIIAGVAAGLSGLCYAEFGCRIPKAGSAYVYSYVSVGEFWAFVVGWNMILQYIIAYGAGGVITAAGSCFFAFAGFDVIGTAGEEAVNPKHSLPLAIILCLAISCLAYLGVATILTLMMPYNQLNPFAPLAEVFSQRGLPGAKYVVATGGLCATLSALLSASFAVPRVVYSMALDGLLFRWFAHVHDKRSVPVRSLLAAGFLIAALALLFDIRQLLS